AHLRPGAGTPVRASARSKVRMVGRACTGSQKPWAASATRRALDRTGVLQVDSVNVLERAHRMPLYSRMGPYDTALLDRANTHTPSRPRRVVEYWAHVQAFMPVELWPVMRPRMEHHRARRGKWWPHEDDALEREVLAA